jgi:hypothetical protein
MLFSISLITGHSERTLLLHNTALSAGSSLFKANAEPGFILHQDKTCCLLGLTLSEVQ